MIQTVWLKRVRFLDDMNKMAAILFKKWNVPVSSMGIFALRATYFGYTYVFMHVEYPEKLKVLVLMNMPMYVDCINSQKHAHNWTV